MRRTHVMHTRDNRRPHYYAQRDHSQQGPVLRWKDVKDALLMFLDDRLVGKVQWTGPEEYGWIDDEYVCLRRRHEAVVYLSPEVAQEKPFDDLGSAKAWCENQFAKGIE